MTLSFFQRLSLLLIASASTTAYAKPEQPSFGTVVFAEQNPPVPGGSLEDLHAHIAELEGTDVALMLVWKQKELENERYWDAARYALEHRIPLQISLQLPEGSTADVDVTGSTMLPADYASTGQFPNATNYAAWIELAHGFMRTWTERGHPPITLVLDLEMRVHQLKQLAAAGNPITNPQAFSERLRSYAVSEAQYSAALQAFKSFVRSAQAQGFRVQANTLLPIVDDYQDGDHDLRRAFQVPLDDAPQSPDATPWDLVSIQVHRSIYSVIADPLSRTLALPPSFVYDYAKLTKQVFGSKAGVDLGLVDAGISTEALTYGSPEGLRADVSRALAAGVPRDALGVFSLTGMLNRGGTAAWFVTAEPATPLQIDALTPIIHGAFKDLDRSLFAP